MIVKACKIGKMVGKFENVKKSRGRKTVSRRNRRNSELRAPKLVTT